METRGSPEFVDICFGGSEDALGVGKGLDLALRHLGGVKFGHELCSL